MSYLRSVLACFLLVFPVCQANTGGLRTSSNAQGNGLVSNAVVGLGAVVGFLFIVFIVLILKRIFFKKDEEEEESDTEICEAYENKAFKVETLEEAKTTSL